jgi:hypothetical protein
MAALSVLLVTGCRKKSSAPTKSAKSTKAATRKVRRTRGEDIRTPAPSTFSIKELDETGRAKIAGKVNECIADERKKRIEGLVHVLIHGQIAEKLKAAAKLSELCDVMAVPFLLTRITAEPNRDVRLAAIAALGHIADPAAAPTLIALLDDEDLGIAMAALDALSEMTGGNYAFVNGTTIKIRKAEKAKWEAKHKEGFFKQFKRK